MSKFDQILELVQGLSAPEALAEEFCKLDDGTQAKFFVEVAKIMEAWGPGKASWQAFYIGRHLRMCECSTEEAREFVRNVASAMVEAQCMPEEAV